jgi:hypothetical protein
MVLSFCRYQHPARFASPRRRGDDCFEIVSCVEHLRSRHESGLLHRQVGCEVLMKLRGIEVSETVSRVCAPSSTPFPWNTDAKRRSPRPVLPFATMLLPRSCLSFRHQSRQKDNWYSVQYRIGFNPCGNFAAICFWHRNIKKNKVGLNALRCLVSPGWFVLFPNGVAPGPFQREFARVSKVAAVINH